MDAEMHIVHMNQNPETKDKFLAAVTGILFKASPKDQIDEMSFADTFIQNLCNGTHHELSLNDFLSNIDFNNRYMYRGSLTTPPYTEGLLWTVLPDVIQINSLTLDLL